MTWTSLSRRRLSTACLCLAALSATTWAQAQTAPNMVSARGATLNMRSAPSADAAVLWKVTQGYPLQVTKRRGNWLQVQDFEGDSGWVARSLTSTTPHHIVKAKVANIRSGPGAQHRLVGQADYGEVLRTQENRADWVRVERAKGPGGWIARPLLWGW